MTLLAREWQFRPNAVSSREWERSRLAALHQMAAGDAPVVVATVDALLARTMPPERLAALSITLETGGRADLKELTRPAAYRRAIPAAIRWRAWASSPCGAVFWTCSPP